MTRLRCKSCALPQLPGFIGQGFCKYHWTARLSHKFDGTVLPADLEEWRKAIADQAAKDRPKLK